VCSSPAGRSTEPETRPGREDICALLDDLSQELAARGLYRQLGFTTVNEGLHLVEQAYPGRPIPAKVRFLLTEIVDSMQN
jgi:hypothetical protein